MSSRFTRRAFIGGAAILALGGAASVRIWQSSRDEKKTRWTIGFSNAWETNTWRTALREPIQEEADRHQDVRLFITDAHDSPSKQVADLEDLLAKGVEGLIIGAATADVAGPILDQCECEGISVVIVEGIPGSGPAVERNAAYDAVLEKYPAIEAVRQAGDRSRASGLRVTENLVTAHRNLDGIHSGGEMALGGLHALREAGVTDDMMRAGKSTLMNVICGALRPDHGSIEIEGRAVRMNSPHDAMRSGISVVHQQFSLVPELTVAENICLGSMPRTRFGLVDWRRLFEVAEEVVKRLGFDLALRRPVKSLGAAACQLVEIARALSTSARVLILDECSAVLGPAELEELFKTIGALKAQGQTIIYISHRLEEIFDVADRVTVMKDGKVTGTYDVDERIDRSFLIREMVGRELTDQRPRGAPQTGTEVLRVENLTRRGAFEDVSLTLHAGEIVGLAGLVGSGRTELSKAIFGALPYESGRIFLNGQQVRIDSPRDALSRGIAYLAEDRHREGMISCLSIVKNLTLPILKRFAPRGVLHLGQENRFVDEMIRKVAVLTRGRHQVVASLSGGNQQKVALAKWLSTQARVFLLDEPTAGIDVGAKSEIYDLMAALARSGAAILMVSSEIPEILSMSSRIVVMRNGHVSGQLSTGEATEQDVLHYFALTCSGARVWLTGEPKAGSHSSGTRSGCSEAHWKYSSMV